MLKGICILTILLCAVTANAVEMPFAGNCNKESNTNFWICSIISSHLSIYGVNVSIVERSRGVTIQSMVSKQFLNSQTLASPGPGRGSWTWSSRGLSDLILGKNQPKLIENIEDLYAIEMQKVSLKKQCGGVDLPWFDKSKKEAFFVRGH